MARNILMSKIFRGLKETLVGLKHSSSQVKDIVYQRELTRSKIKTDIGRALLIKNSVYDI